MELMYPLSPDYVADWTVPRALAELVANALDEDLKATFRWDDSRGLAVITDKGPGWPEEGLVMGYTTKQQDQIGQFGEGAKLAMLVLARELGPQAVEVRTSGFTLRPRIEKRRLGLVDGRQAREDRPDDGVELLMIEVHPSRRRQGTVIEVRCSPEQFLDAHRRFRHFQVRSYRSPQTTGVVVPGQSGSVYIGGVLLRDDLELTLSYDFGLSRAKHLQNRDRTTLDGWALSHLIGEVISSCTDVDALERFSRAALSGELSRMEQDMSEVDLTDERRARAWRQVRRRLFGSTPVFFVPPGQEELELDLQDLGHTKVSCDMSAHATANLMTALAVPQATRATRRGRTKWVPRTRLDEQARTNLRTALRQARRRFGPTCVGRVRVFDTHESSPDRSEGFYDPQTGDVALHVSVLGDLQHLRVVLAHEIAHRRAHLLGREWRDRTRGFEHTLSEMAALSLEPRGTKLSSPGDPPD